MAAIRFVATGYLPAVRRLSGKANTGGLPKVAAPQGDVEERLQGTSPAVTITNYTPGIGAANAKHGIVAQALATEAADMEDYINRKRAETGQRLLNF